MKESKKCFIPVECSCCGEMELLFEGNVNNSDRLRNDTCISRIYGIS